MIVGDPAERARELIVFADGVELGGDQFVGYARRARAVARDVLELAEQLESARSMNDALVAERDRLRGLLVCRGVVEAKP